MAKVKYTRCKSLPQFCSGKLSLSLQYSQNALLLSSTTLCSVTSQAVKILSLFYLFKYVQIKISHYIAMFQLSFGSVQGYLMLAFLLTKAVLRTLQLAVSTCICLRYQMYPKLHLFSLIIQINLPQNYLEIAQLFSFSFVSKDVVQKQKEHIKVWK